MVFLILDLIEHIESYRGISDAFDTVVSVISDINFMEVQPGTYFLESTGAYYMVQEYLLKSREETHWESHDQFIDIQYVFAGGPEIIDWAPRISLIGWAKDPSGDISFADGDGPHIPLKLFHGQFAVFFPQDAHRPCQGLSIPCSKVVFKIPISR